MGNRFMFLIGAISYGEPPTLCELWRLLNLLGAPLRPAHGSITVIFQFRNFLM
jgi:hypothetical protein